MSKLNQSQIQTLKSRMAPEIRAYQQAQKGVQGLLVSRKFWLIISFVYVLLAFIDLVYTYIFVAVLVPVLGVWAAVMYQKGDAEALEQAKTQAKNKLLEALIKQHELKLSYQAQAHVALEDYNTYAQISQLIMANPPVFQGRDFFQGQTRHGLGLKFGFVQAGQPNLDQKKYDFQGLVAVARLPKGSVTGPVLVYPDHLEKQLGHRLRKGNVYLENPVFERHFAVSSPNEVEAFKLLTPAVQERLADLAQQAKYPFHFAFYQDKYYFFKTVPQVFLLETLEEDKLDKQITFLNDELTQFYEIIHHGLDRGLFTQWT